MRKVSHYRLAVMQISPAIIVIRRAGYAGNFVRRVRFGSGQVTTADMVEVTRPSVQVRLTLAMI